MKTLLSQITIIENKLNNTIKQKKTFAFYLVYTLLFTAISLVVFSWYYRNGKSFVWALSDTSNDGLTQNFNAFCYIGTYIKQIFETLFLTGKLTFPMWDFNIGLGSDILTTLNFYGFGDPLSILSAFCPYAALEYLYDMLIIVRLYLAGIAFSVYCTKIVNKGRIAILAGAIIYVFCGFSLFSSVRHPMFIDPMICLPLILLGVEKITRHEKPYLFILMIFLSAISSFYFFYMLSIFMAIYIIIRVISSAKVQGIRHSMINIRNIAGFYAIGILMACVILLPNIVNVLSSSRLSADKQVNLRYSFEYYVKSIPGFIAAIWPGNWAYMSYTGLSFLAVILLFAKRRMNPDLKAGFVLLTLFLMIPLAGFALTGFTYPSNRWIWALSFTVALAVTIMLPELSTLSKKDSLALSILSGAYFIPGAFVSLYFEHTMKFFAAYALLVAQLVCFIILSVQSRKQPEFIQKHSRKIGGLIIALTAVSVIVSAASLYSPLGDDYASEFVKSGDAYSRLTDTSAKAVSQLTDMSFYRYEENRIDQTAIYNSAMLNNQNSTSFYYSAENGNIARFNNEIGLYNSMSWKYIGFDGRTFLDEIASVKYFVVGDGLEKYLPHGYSKLVSTSELEGLKYCVYENEYALPIGYTYQSYIPRAIYDALTMAQKQQALLQGAVLDIDQLATIKKTQLSFNDRALPYEIVCGDGITCNDGRIVVKDTATSIKITTEGTADCETYVCFDNLWYAGSINPAYIYWDTGNIKGNLSVSTPHYSFYSNKHNYLINMRTLPDARTVISMTFSCAGVYTFDRLSILSQPMASYPSQAAALKRDVLQNVVMSGNQVSGDINAGTNEILCLTIPYSNGWTATVNGEKAEVLRVNTMYMGIVLTPGHHDIELNYVTPGLAPGLALSAAGLLSFIALIVGTRLKKRRQVPKSTDSL